MQPPPVRWWQIHIQALGFQFLTSLRPDNVAHPHLRAHLDFHIGLLLSVELVRNTWSQYSVRGFLAGCGIQFQRDGGE